MKLKPLVGILALCIAFICAIRVAAGWFPGEEAMLRALQQTSLTTKTAIAADESQVSPDFQSGTTAIETMSPPAIPAVSPSPFATSNAVADRIDPPCKPAQTVSSTGVNTSLAGRDPYSYSVSQYQPNVEVRLADPTNFGDRFTTDVYGNPVANDFIAVLHETVYSADSAINYFQTPHPKDEDQASYHTLIRRNGTVIYVVPPEKRAFGAGNSVFNGANGPESVKTKRDLAPSVNNFAYHVSFESPIDGRNQSRAHSGYTSQQYQSLAWLLAQTSIPEDRITTHRSIDRSGSRYDPRSFDRNRLLALLEAYPRSVRSVSTNRCAPPTVAQQPTSAPTPANLN